MDTDPVLTTRIEVRNGITSVALTGELDMGTVPIFDERLAASTRDGASVVVLDIRSLRFVDSSGLHALVRAYERSEQDGHRLLVVGANPFVRRLCEMTGTRFLLDAKGTAEILGRFTGERARADGDERRSADRDD